MKIFRSVANSFMLRRVLRTLGAVESQLAEQNKLLARLADHFAPVIPAPPEDLQKQTSVDFLNEVEKGRTLDYIEKVLKDGGRPPTEDELIAYLAEEDTQAVTAHQKGQVQ